MKSFILMGATKIPDKSDPPSSHVYDDEFQIWIDTLQNEPLISQITQQLATRFGETTITETREGADQSEISSVAITTQFDAADDIEFPAYISNYRLESTRFGETTITKTSEGVDTSEATTENYMDTNAAHSHF